MEKDPEALQAFSWLQAVVLGVGLQRGSGLLWSLDVMRNRDDIVK